MRRRHSEEPVSDINITPLTDVMMVLLIIFMISSPVLLAKGMEIHLPQVTEAPMLVEEDHVLYVSEQLEIILDGQQYTYEQLYGQFVNLVETADADGEVVNLFVRADKAVSYGDITAVMNVATQAGIERLSMVQDVIEGAPPEPESTEPAPTDSSGESAVVGSTADGSDVNGEAVVPSPGE